MKTKENKGITLIALVLTIIVLLILSGISISMLTGENGILTRAKEAKEKTELANKEEKEAIDSLQNLINNSAVSTDGYVDSKKVNKPKLTTGMIPVKWLDNNWVVCSEDDAEWYKYDSNKQWANVMLSDGTYKADNVKIGQVVEEKDLGSMYVWIPRYAYKIVEEKNIKVTFLKGNTNEGTDGIEYTENQSTDTTKSAIVHPAFNLGGTELTGFWIAKFEASGTNKDGNAVGNASKTTGHEEYTPDETTTAKSLPNKISWRHITIGECEKRSMDIATTEKSNFGLKGATSHLIKNNEWGAVAYLCYSEFGAVPMTNGTGDSTSYFWYDLYTGQGPKNANDEGMYSYDIIHNYSTPNGVLSSTTKNVTGVYDMAGGAWEYVAGYLDNGNENLNSYGKSKDGSVKYFENGKLNSMYSNLWNTYEVSDEERTGKVTLSDGTIETNLEDISKTEYKYQEARYRLTKYTYDKLANNKGIGANEVGKKFAFYAPVEGLNYWYWFTNAECTGGDGEAWDNDILRIGSYSYSFIIRGGDCTWKNTAGVLAYGAELGRDFVTYGFRSVLVI